MVCSLRNGTHGPLIRQLHHSRQKSLDLLCHLSQTSLLMHLPYSLWHLNLIQSEGLLLAMNAFHSILIVSLDAEGYYVTFARLKYWKILPFLSPSTLIFFPLPQQLWSFVTLLFSSSDTLTCVTPCGVTQWCFFMPTFSLIPEISERLPPDTLSLSDFFLLLHWYLFLFLLCAPLPLLAPSLALLW